MLLINIQTIRIALNKYENTVTVHPGDKQGRSQSIHKPD